MITWSGNDELKNMARDKRLDLSALLKAQLSVQKRILSEEYNVSPSLPDDQFFDEIRQIGERKVQEAKDRGATPLKEVDLKNVILALD